VDWNPRSGLARDCVQDFRRAYQEQPHSEQGWAHCFQVEARDCQEGEAPSEGRVRDPEGEVRVRQAQQDEKQAQ